MSWLSMIGGGITAAATLAVGISTSGILASNPASSDLAPAAGETIYVEQPVIQVSDSGSPLATSDPIVIAILPAPTESDPTLAPDPSMPAPSFEDEDGYEDGDEYEGEYEDEDEDEGEYEDEDEGEYEEEDEDEGEYEEEDEYEDEGPEEGDSD